MLKNPEAFPVVCEDTIVECGMTLRDYFAAKAMAALIRTLGDMPAVPHGLTRDAYEMADAMLLEREK